MIASITLPRIYGSPLIQYRVLEGQPSPYMATIQRRTLTPEGGHFKGDASDWRTLPIAEVKHQLRLDGPVAYWLRTQTNVDCSNERFCRYLDDSQPAHLWTVNAIK